MICKDGGLYKYRGLALRGKKYSKNEKFLSKKIFSKFYQRHPKAEISSSSHQKKFEAIFFKLEKWDVWNRFQ